MEAGAACQIDSFNSRRVGSFLGPRVWVAGVASSWEAAAELGSPGLLPETLLESYQVFPYIWTQKIL